MEKEKHPAIARNASDAAISPSLVIQSVVKRSVESTFFVIPTAVEESQTQQAREKAFGQLLRFFDSASLHSE